MRKLLPSPVKLALSVVFLSVLLALTACTPAPMPTEPCRAWPSAPDRALTTSDILALAADGKHSYDDCRARYDMLRAAVE